MSRKPLRRLPVLASAAAALCVLGACHSLRAADVRGAEFDHVGLNVARPQEAAAWYARHLGGKILSEKSAATPAVAFGKTTLRFYEAAGTVAGSVGSGVDHIGFSYADLDAAMKRFARDGVKIVSGIERDGPILYAFINDPWGTLIEVVQDPKLLGFHHVHLATSDPKSLRRWYTRNLGGKFARFYNLMGGMRYGDVWMLIKTVERPLHPTKGRAIDHIGWTVADLKAAVKELKADGTLVESAPLPDESARRVFVTGPDGVRIELVQRTSARQP